MRLKRLDSHDGAGRKSHDRLVVNDYLVVLQRLLEVAHDTTVERRPRHDGLLARVPLRRVHLAVGSGEQVAGRRPSCGKSAQPIEASSSAEPAVDPI